jgi:hypothetical protein
MKISEKKKEKISEQIIAFLYSQSPKLLFTVEIAHEMARDEEFMKKLLIGLKSKNLVVEIKKNSKGKEYTKRSRWKISDAAYTAYSLHQ